MSDINNIKMMSQDIKSLLSQIEALRLEAEAYDFATLSCLLGLAYKEALACSGKPLPPAMPMLTTTLQ